MSVDVMPDQTPAEAPPQRPPDEHFWVKYSPNAELTVSGLAAIAWHVFAIVVLGVIGFVISYGSRPTMPVEAIEFGDAGGGGGDPNGAGTGKGEPLIERASLEELPAEQQTPNVSIGVLPDVRSETPLPDLPDNPESDRILDKSKDAKGKLKDVGKGGPPAKPGQGKGGPGSGGGSGTGTGPGTGSGTGEGPGGSIRAKRGKRWVMTFNTRTGEDYLQQLSLLGCILVMEYPDGKTEMFRKLSDPPVPAEPFEKDFVSNRQSWYDDSPNTLADLARAMGIKTPPRAFKAYFPLKLEDELLDKELKFRGRKEDDIHSTRFQVYVTGNSYRLVVVEQKYLR